MAEYLFGTPERLIRLDMSEFQQSSSVDKIIGASDDESMAQSLIQRVRKQPFAVILLDEFEKAHANVWDLFLQVFDDGRLTDTMGQVADFRHTIIILTSNLGATAHQSAGLGFAPRGDAFSQEQVRRAVSQSFRPEFVNRLDKVIVFRPLTRDRMRSILRKELARVLERRGLAESRMGGGVGILGAGIPARKGIHRRHGRAAAEARHRSISARAAGGDHGRAALSDRRPVPVRAQRRRGDPGRVRRSKCGSRGTRVPAAGEPAAAVASTGSRGAGIGRTAARGHASRARAIVGHSWRASKRNSPGAEWEQLRDELAAQMSEAGFWDRDDRQRLLARFALMDRVKAALGTARSLSERHGRGLSGRAGTFSRELAGRFALQLLLVDRGIRDALGDAPSKWC